MTAARHLHLVPSNVVNLPTALPGTGRPGNPEATRQLAEQHKSAVLMRATCGHANATIVVLSGAFRVSACPPCAVDLSQQKPCYLTLGDGPDGSDAA